MTENKEKLQKTTAINGVKLTVYFADTLRNEYRGHSPNTVVPTDVCAIFQPNGNRNPQSTKYCGYGMMILPSQSDYYVVASKNGYVTYSSSIISVYSHREKWVIKMKPSN
jgi:hypothetical protein